MTTRLIVASKSIIDDLSRYVSTQGEGPDMRLVELHEAIADAESEQPVTSEGLLCSLLGQWCVEQGLECESADEMSHRDDITEAQREWLYTFGELWDATV